MELSTQPYKGARDFYPEDFRIRSFIFEKWRKICKKYGYEEYDGPFLESFDIYAAKSGEELVNEQLYSFEDRGKRKVAIRPEMTPTLSRMVAQKFNELPRPIKWFSIPNLWRYEKPQKGRLREHFQLNVDNFGIEGMGADFEIVSIFIDVVREFGGKEGMFEIRVGNRRFTNDILKEIGIPEDRTFRTTKILDKKNKISKEDFEKLLAEEAKLTKEQIKSFQNFLENPKKLLDKMEKVSQGAREIRELLDLCKISGIEKFVRYDPTIIRGLDYYTGNVFEMYDLSPNGARAMAGGGRYDDLVETFIGKKFSGIGCAMGDVTFKNFLENWNLLPVITSECEYLVTLWPGEKDEYLKVSLEVANLLRKKDKNVQIWLEKNTKLDKQLKYADKKQIKFAVIIGDDELRNKAITIKNLVNKSQETKPLEKFLSEIQ